MSETAFGTASDTLTLAQALNRAHAHWNAGQAGQAEILCQRVLAVFPGQPDALHLLGLMAHSYGKLDMAIQFLQQACRGPNAPAIYFSNLAEMCRQAGRLDEGRDAGRRAVQLDPSQVSAWNNLGIILQETGSFEESRECLDRVVALQPDWAQGHNNLGNTYRRLNRFDLAEQYYRHAIDLDPDYAEAHSNLAFLLALQGCCEEGEAEARQAIDLNPRLADAYLNLAEVEMSRHRYDDAMRALDMLQAFAPRHPSALVAKAKALNKLNRYDEALDFARLAVEQVPQSAEAQYALALVLQSLGHTEEALLVFEKAVHLPGAVTEEAMVGRATLLMEAGRKEEARAAFEAAIAAFPASTSAIAGRADMHAFTVGDPDFAVLENALTVGERASLGNRIAIHFALGKAYFDIGNSAKAFACFNEGNRLKRTTFTYDAAATTRWLQHVAEVFTPEVFSRLTESMSSGQSPELPTSELPVFIVGMPRSGTTLIEQILSSHPQVMGAGELSALRLAVDTSGVFPDRVRQMDASLAAHLGRDYLARVMPLAKGRDRLVDKMPGNFLYAGLIPLILPGARIIHARRHPVDTCLSCYTKLFSGDLLFSYELAELGGFYRAYDALMAHWRSVLPPQRFIEVEYEAVVEDIETQAKRMIEFLGLPWNEACLNFHDNRRVVRTASVNQVRKPIYKTSRGRWRKHAEHLGPLLAALGVEVDGAAENSGPRTGAA
jgi:tetratricopeptide (TPR) repeat protein